MGGELRERYLVKGLSSSSDPFMIQFDVSPDSPSGLFFFKIYIFVHFFIKFLLIF